MNPLWWLTGRGRIRRDLARPGPDLPRARARLERTVDRLTDTLERGEKDAFNRGETRAGGRGETHVGGRGETHVGGRGETHVGGRGETHVGGRGETRARGRGDPGVERLLGQALTRLVGVAIAQGDFDSAASSLGRLDELDLDPELGTPAVAELRWELITALRSAGHDEPAIRHARAHIADRLATPVQLTELLRWALTWTDSGGRREFAAGVPLPDNGTGPLGTLKALCIAPDDLDDPVQAEALAAGLLPELLAAWPHLQRDAHLLKARCAEARGRWAGMLLEANRAADVRPHDPEPRYWRARALMRSGRFAEAAETLAEQAIVSPGGWPVPLLRAVCAAMDADLAELQRQLAQAPPVAYAGDHRVLAFVRDALIALSDVDPQLDPAGIRPGPITRALPELSGLLTLLTSAVAVVSGAPERPVSLPRVRTGGGWSSWLLCRLAHALGGVPEVVDFARECGLAWERLGTLQDLSAHLEPGVRAEVTAGIAAFAERDDGRARLALTRWDGLEKVVPDPAPATGIPGPLARLDAAVERAYLSGRLALREGRPDEALRWFAQAWPTTGGTLAKGLVLLRFAPLLSYWEGVALAHLGRLGEAETRLGQAMRGAMAPQARAQAGLVALARGRPDEARGWLAQVGAHRPASADYLASLLGEQNPVHDDGVYAAAAHRLLGRRHESKVELDTAREHYRKALDLWPGDAAAAAGHDRVLLRRRFESIRCGGQTSGRIDDGAGFAGELDGTMITVRTCLELASGDPVDAARLEAHATRPSLRRLFVSSLAVAGRQALAAEAAARWAGATPELAEVAELLAAREEARTLCLAGGGARWSGSVIVKRLRVEISAYQRMDFWKAVAEAVSHPENAARVMAPFVFEQRCPADYRRLAAFFQLFAGDAEDRRAAAVRLWGDETAGPVAWCLATSVLGNDRDLLELCARLDVRELPCEPADIYCAASLARLRAGDIDAVIGGPIPEALQDLADPAVRRVMAFAFARRAVRDGEIDPRSALWDTEQALDLLRPEDEG